MKPIMKFFALTTQHPKSKQLGKGTLSINKHGEAMFFENNGTSEDKVLASMERVQIAWAGADGIFLSGFERGGNQRDGRAKFLYQEWFLRYRSEDQPQNFVA